MKKPEKGTGRSRRDAGKWVDLLAAREKSGLSVKSFCALQGIGLGSYYRWQQLLKEEPRVQFSPIEIQTKVEFGLVVDLPGGVSLRFSELPPVAYLRSLSVSFSDSGI